MRAGSCPRNAQCANAAGTATARAILTVCGIREVPSVIPVTYRPQASIRSSIRYSMDRIYRQHRVDNKPANLECRTFRREVHTCTSIQQRGEHNYCGTMKRAPTQLLVRRGREYALALRQHASTQLPCRSPCSSSSELDVTPPPLPRLRLRLRLRPPSCPNLPALHFFAVEDSPSDEERRPPALLFLRPAPSSSGSLSLLLSATRRLFRPSPPLEML